MAREPPRAMLESGAAHVGDTPVSRSPVVIGLMPKDTISYPPHRAKSMAPACGSIPGLWVNCVQSGESNEHRSDPPLLRELAEIITPDPFIPISLPRYRSDARGIVENEGVRWYCRTHDQRCCWINDDASDGFINGSGFSRWVSI